MRRQTAPSVYLAIEAVGGFLFEMYVVAFAIYLIRDVHLNPLQLVLMGTVLEATYFVFNVPMGVLADVLSRRATIIAGHLISGSAFFMLAVVRSFPAAALSQAIWAVGAALHSGADVAWITDEVGEEAARPLYLRAGQYGNIGGLAGIVVGISLATIHLPVPIAVSGLGMFAVGLSLIFLMPEDRFVKPTRADGEHVRHSLADTAKRSVHDVGRHPILLLVLVVAALHGASTEGFDRLADFHVLKDIGLPAFGSLNPILWFGVIDAGALLLGIGATEFVKRKVDLEHVNGAARVLVVIDSLLIAFVVVFGLLGEFGLALLAFWSVAGLRTLRESVFHAWINRGLDSRTRATINSMAEQADAIGQTVGGPMLGIIAKTRSVTAAIVTAGIVPLPVLGLYARAIRKGTAGALEPTEVEDLAPD